MSYLPQTTRSTRRSDPATVALHTACYSVAPLTVHCREYGRPCVCANGSPRLSPQLWRCAQYVAVLPLAVYCRGYGRPCICANGSPCLSSRSVALQDSRLSCHHRLFTAEDITGPCSLFYCFSMPVPEAATLRTAGCSTAVGGSLPRIRLTLHLR